ncbi:hypothetical protein ACHAXR_011172, partial [Thalassiosira sp. AJA248-18]
LRGITHSGAAGFADGPSGYFLVIDCLVETLDQMVRTGLKIFDFGLARIMPENGDNNNDVFAMSGAGSPRYMAPECLSESPYNLKADVYSFAIVLWEIFSGKNPHAFVRSRDQLIHYVVEQNGRPVIEESWPSPIQGMLESSFDSEIEKRPKMALWYGVIRKTLASLRRGDMRGLTDSKVLRRRSSQSLGDLFKKELVEGGVESINSV